MALNDGWERVPEDAGWEPVPEKDYDFATKALDLAKTAFKSMNATNTGLADIVDIAAQTGRAAVEMPFGGLVQAASEFTGVGDYQDPYPEAVPLLDAPGAALDRGMELHKGGLGQATEEIRRRANILQQEIPEGAGGKAFDRANTGAEIVGSYINPITPVAGGVNAVRGLVGATGAGIIGEEVGGETGQMVGTIGGDLLGTALLRNPATTYKALEGLATGTGDIVKNSVESVKNWFKGKSGLNKKAMVDTASDADLIKATREILNRASVPEEISSIVDDAARASALDDFAVKLEAQIADALKQGKGSIGQLTRNPGILAFEDEMANLVKTPGKPSNEAIRSFNKANQIKSDIAAGAQRELAAVAPTGEAARASEAVRPGLERSRQAITQQAEAATEGVVESAEVGLKAATAGRRAAEEGQQLKLLNEATLKNQPITAIGDEGVEQLDGVLQNAYNTAWGAGGKKATIANRKAIDLIDEALDGVVAKTGRTFRSVRSDIEALAKDASPAALKELDGMLRQQMKAAFGSNMKLYDDLQSVRQTLRTRLPAASQRMLKEADTAYPKFLTLENASIGNKAAMAGGKFTPDQVVSGAGSVNKKNRPLLESAREYDQVAQAQDDLVRQADEGVTIAQKQVDKLRADAGKEVKDLGRTPGAKFSEAEGIVVDDAVEKILKGGPKKQPVKAVTELVDSVKGNPQGQEHIKRAFVEQFQNSLSKNGELTQDGMEAFKRLRPIMEKSGLMNADELGRIERAMVENQKNFLAGSADIAGATATQMSISEVLAGLAGAKVGAFAFGSPLIGAAYGRKITSKMLDEATKGRIKDLAYELTVSPEKFSGQIEKLQTSVQNMDEFMAVISDMTSRLAPATATQADVINN